MISLFFCLEHVIDRLISSIMIQSLKCSLVLTFINSTLLVFNVIICFFSLTKQLLISTHNFLLLKLLHPYFLVFQRL